MCYAAAMDGQQRSEGSGEEARAHLRALVAATFGEPVPPGEPIPGGGSERRFFRFAHPRGSVVGVHARHAAETRAFLGFTRHFAARGIPVPRLYAADEARGLYLLEDLGPHTLAGRLRAWRAAGDEARCLAALETVVRWLPAIQVRGGAGLDYGLCHEGDALGAEAFRADVARFETAYLARHAPAFRPDAAVRAGLAALIAELDAVPRPYFCYRDFQTRNVMWRDDAPVFLDYQSGRRGALHYDLASLLYSPDSGLDDAGRDRLVTAYLEALADCGERPQPTAFRATLARFALVRRLQALGAYAHLARREGSEDFRARIPGALADLRGLVAAGAATAGLPALHRWLEAWLEGRRL